jgi:biopolymer transport protein ExbD
MAHGSHSMYEDEDAAITDINVTPLVDVMLVLLVIFMVTARLIVSRGVEVSRPRAAAGGPIKSPIMVSVDKDGKLFVEGEEQPDTLAAVAKLRELAAGAADAKVIIDGDASAAYGGVMRAIDVITAAEIHKIALANAPLPEGVPPGGGP